MIRSYSELRQLETLEERFDYLNLHGQVGSSTFGYDRFINQKFYTSSEWKFIRHHVIVRDNACDLGIPGYEIHDKIVIHHMNPMEVSDIAQGEAYILNPEFLITTTHRTHNAIHFGDKKLLPKPFVPRKVGDTKLW